MFATKVGVKVTLSFCQPVGTQHIYDRKDGESIMREKLDIPAPTTEAQKLAADIEAAERKEELAKYAQKMMMRQY